VRFEDDERRCVELELVEIRVPFHDERTRAAVEMQPLPGGRGLARAELDEHAPLVERAFQQYLDAAAALLTSV
jgi:hypothetical protein